MRKHYKQVVTYGSTWQCLDQDRVPCSSVNWNRRLTLLLLNGVLILAAIIVTSFASFSLIVEGSFVQGSSIEYFTLTLAILVIFPGITTILSSSLVFIASNRRRLSHLYNTLGVIFTFAAMVEIVVFFFGVYQVSRIEELTNSIVDWSLFIKYYQEEHIRNDLDVIQRELKCCGFKSYKDWELNPYYSCKFTGYARCSVPFSCCRLKTAGASCALGIRNSKITEAKLRESIYLDGCLKTSKIWYKHTVILLSFSAILMAVLQGLFFLVLNLVVGHTKSVKKRIKSIRKPYHSNPEDSAKKTEYSSASKQDTIVKL